MSKRIPNLASAVITGGKQEVAEFGEEFHFLHPLRMPLKSVYPFLGNVVLSLIQWHHISFYVGWHFKEILTQMSVVKYGPILEGLSFLRPTSLLLWLKSLLSHLLVFFYYLLLLFAGAHTLLFCKMFHTFVDCPRSHEIVVLGISLCLPLFLHFFLESFFAFFVPKVLILEILLQNMCLIKKSRKMIWLRLNLIFFFEEL